MTARSLPLPSLPIPHGRQPLPGSIIDYRPGPSPGPRCRIMSESAERITAVTVQMLVEGVSKRFGVVTAVDGVSVDVPKGRILSIIGPNGAGKTSLLNMISGFYKPDTGRITLEGRTDRETPVHEIMSSPLVVVMPETTIDECMAVMTDRRIRHLPVVEDGDVVGVVSIGDLVKFKSKQQTFEVEYLTRYITAG